MTKILCVGALTFDTIYRLDHLPLGPGKILPREAVQLAQGMAAAQAATIARLGGKAALWASVGNDLVGDRLISDIGALGVDCSRVRRVPGARSAFAGIFMDMQGQTMIVPQYDEALASEPTAVPELFEFDAVMVDMRWPAAARLMLKAAREAEIPGILDADMATRELLEDLLPLASHVVAAEGAAKLLTGAGTAEAAAAALGERGHGFVAVTAGADGCWWTDGAAITHTDAPEIVPVDTLAAGDVFHGAFAYGLAEGWEMDEIIRFASVAAAIKCTRFGGRLGAPTRNEVEGFVGARTAR